ncbi:MAG: hypothetical protein KKE86_04225 [Planctomycetes bacterium]|nr:hypothetical protein [Planctomycetota bacterium]MBU4398524.1 hypothetical protein [Planctomycetota bacterium]MCG2684808.1 hypothetical protein [Planctomycetales bacterium]
MGIVKERLRLLRNTNLWAEQFLLELGSAQGYLNRDYLPEWCRGDAPLDWNQWNAVALLLNTCRSLRSLNDPFPQEFAAVQHSPVECCGEIEPNAHWLTWVLSQQVLRSVCEAVLPGSTKSGGTPFLTDKHWESANWSAVNRAIQLDTAEIARLGALLNQEYQRAINLVKSQRRERLSIQKADGGLDRLAGAANDTPIVSLTPPQITIDGTAYAVTEEAAKLLNDLVTANDWVSGHSIVNQPSRVVAKMPDPVKKLVESAPGKGFRLRRKQ